MDEESQVSIEELRKFEPLATLSEERLTELGDLADIQHINIGTHLFREGDVDGQTIYLLKGDIQLSRSDGTNNEVIRAGTEKAKFPIDDSQPRQQSCRAMSLVDVIRIDNGVLDYMMTWDQLAVSETLPKALPEFNPVITQKLSSDQQQPESEALPSTQIAQPLGRNKEWVRKVRQIMAFKSMPTANIRPLLDKMESIDVKKGDVVVRQGDEGDYYYVLTEGEAQVTRTVKLATLTAGTSFGEEALLAESKRNASVTMKTDGTIMRLSKTDFDELLKEPLLKRISPDEARVEAARGAQWLDVRHAKEFHYSRLPKAINIPLHELRMRLNELDKDKHYIVYCGTGRRSAAAAFLLCQHGFKASLLNGGVQVMAKDLVK